MLTRMSDPSPRRSLGTLDAACVVVGAIIGVGIFFSPGRVAAVAGTPGLALAGWTLAGFVAMCGAMAFAELGRRRNGPGAQYLVLRDAYGKGGPLAGFVFVFCNATFVQVGAIVVISVICARYLAVAVGRDDLPGWVLSVMGILLIGVVTGINIAGVRAGTLAQNLTVAGKVAALLGVTALAWFAPGVERAEVPTEPKGSTSIALTLMACLVPAFFAYGGWQQALWISGEVKNPRRTLPVAILAGTGLVVVVYLLVNWAYLSMLGVEKVATSRSLAADAVATVFPAWGGRAIAAAVAVSAFGVLNAQLLTGPRLVQAMAADGRFWRVFARVSGHRSTPVPAIAMLGGLSAAVLAAAGHERVDQISAGVVVVDGVSFILTAAAVFWLPFQRSEGPSLRPLPGAKVAAGLFVLGEIGLVIGAHADDATRKAAWVGLAWMLAAVLLFLTVFRKKDGPHQQPDSNDATKAS